MEQTTLISISLAVYMTASVFVAAVRWGHRCSQYAHHMDYYYPAWKVVVFCYLANLFMLPALFLPQESDAVLQLRLLLILASPFFCALVMFCYFGKVMGFTKWRKPVFFLAVAFGLMAVSATVLALLPGTQMTPSFCSWYFSLGGILAVAFLLCFITSFILVAHRQRRQMEENYSNPDDFPHKYASHILWLPVAHLLVSWACTFIGTPGALCAGLLMLSVLSLILLIGILSPHREMSVEDLEAAENPASPTGSTSHEEITLTDERQDDIERAIRQFVEKEQGFLDSHLTLASLSRRIGFNRKYASIVISSRLGGFFTYVNRCRLAHVARLTVEHPDWSLGTIIENSGFGSRTTYYKVRKQLIHSTPSSSSWLPGMP